MAMDWGPGACWAVDEMNVVGMEDFSLDWPIYVCVWGCVWCGVGVVCICVCVSVCVLCGYSQRFIVLVVVGVVGCGVCCNVVWGGSLCGCVYLSVCVCVC